MNAGDERRRARRPRGIPWSRALIALATIGPALYFGGTRAETVVYFSVVALALWLRTVTRTSAAVEVPKVAFAGAVLVGITVLQWAPIPGLREALAPDIAAQVSAALEGTGVAPRPGLTVSAADTGLEVGRVVALLALFIAAAQVSWRTTAAMAVAVGSTVALLGFVHAVLGLDAIYGTYRAKDVDLGSLPSLLTTFVNPNHQSSLLLLGALCAAALAFDQHAQGLSTRDPAKVDSYGDRMLAALAAMALQLPALVLSLSRGAIVTLLLLAPVAGWLALRKDPSRRVGDKRRRHMSPLRWFGLATLVALMLLVARHGAWRELLTLGSVFDSTADTQAKLRIVAESRALLAQSPWLGTGRGTFLDLFGPIDTAPTHVLHTHLESAPAAIVVEWGLPAGGLLLAAGVVWLVGAWRRDPKRADATARRLAILGVVAVALHNTVDFSWEFLGVTAPCVAVAAGLSSNTRLTWSRRSALAVMTPALVASTWLAATSYPGTFARRPDVDREVAAGEVDPATALRARPLDARLHRQLARLALAQGEPARALHHARVATSRRPGEIDGWLLLAAAQRALGRPEAAAIATKQALARLHEIPQAELAVWLAASLPDPAQLVAIAPEDPVAWHRLMDALVVVAPRHADALAAARTEDPIALHYRVGVAMAAGNAALALHHARLWRAAAPTDAGSHRAVALALRAFDPARLDESRQALEEGLATPELDDPAPLEEELVRTLADLGRPEHWARAEEVAQSLLRREADRATQTRRGELVRRLRATMEGS